MLTCAVPQGSILGPIIFLLYTADILRIVELHVLSPHLYADDTQIYGRCSPADVAQCQQRGITTKIPENFVKVSPPVSEIGIFHFPKVSYTLKTESIYSHEYSFARELCCRCMIKKQQRIYFISTGSVLNLARVSQTHSESTTSNIRFVLGTWFMLYDLQ